MELSARDLALDLFQRLLVAFAALPCVLGVLGPAHKVL